MYGSFSERSKYPVRCCHVSFVDLNSYKRHIKEKYISQSRTKYYSCKHIGHFLRVSMVTKVFYTCIFFLTDYKIFQHGFFLLNQKKIGIIKTRSCTNMCNNFLNRTRSELSILKSQLYTSFIFLVKFCKPMQQ